VHPCMITTPMDHSTSAPSRDLIEPSRRLAAAGLVAALACGAASATAAEQVLKLPGEILGAVELSKASGAGQLGVFIADDHKPTRQRSLILYEKDGSQLKPVGRHMLWEDAGAFDRCRLDPSGDTLLYVRPDGIYRHGS